jgi:thiol-disulfide isomerase/thioredoxin
MGEERHDFTDWRVICLCAAWCGVCREWTPVFEQLSTEHPQARFGWIDVEDEADAMGDVDIETFPTLLIAQGGHARFFGPVQPSAAQVSRLLESLHTDPRAGRETSEEAHALLARITPLLLPKS